MKRLFSSIAVRLLAAIAVGIAVGYLLTVTGKIVDEIALQILLTLKHVTGQIILFMVPLIIFGCVAPSITRFGSNVNRLILITLGLAYVSSIGAATLAIGVSRCVVPMLSFAEPGTASRTLPEMLLRLNFPTVDTMSILLLAILLGLGTVWVKFSSLATFLDKFQDMILAIVRKILLPILPVFIGCNFALLAYKGQIEQMKIFLPIVLLIVTCQLIWLVILYGSASLYSKKNSWQVARYYPKAYFTAVGTMSSAATLPVALECIAQSPIVRRDTYDFALPLFSNLHLCGSVIAEMFLVTGTYYLLTGTLPELSSMAVFAILACVIAIGSPGVPGGLNMSCMSLVGSLVLAPNPEIATEFFAVMTAIYTIQDGFGTACNVTGDGALTLIVDTGLKRSN